MRMLHPTVVEQVRKLGREVSMRTGQEKGEQQPPVILVIKKISHTDGNLKFVTN